MIRHVVVAALLISPGLSLAQAPASSQTWNIDPNHSAAQFAVRHMLVSTVRGQFDKMSGTLTYDGADLHSLGVQATIDAASVDTRVTPRDNDLRSPNFFEVDKYPTITFVSKRVDAVDAGGHCKLIGDLTIHGVTREVALDVDASSPPVKMGPMIRLGATATTKINRRDFGLQYNKMMEGAAVVGDEVTITIDVEATRRTG